MPVSNICKFISHAISDTLTVSCFVLESDPFVMKNEYVLKENRAILVINGSGEFVFNGKKLAFSVGTLAFGFKNESFSVPFSSDGTQYIYISFDGGRADELFRRFDIQAANRCFTGLDSIIPHWIESLERANELTVDLAAESVLLYTFSRLFGSAVQSSGIVGKMISETEERFNDPMLSLSVLAEELSYNSKYLSHVFKEKMGIGYSEYLRETRIKFARSLLDRGLDSVKNVALLSGFNDPLYFSSVFKKTMGMSPLSYVQKNYNK